MKAWHSLETSGTMALFKAINVTEVLDMAEPPVRQPGIKVADTTALLGAIGSGRLFQNVGA